MPTDNEQFTCGEIGYSPTSMPAATVSGLIFAHPQSRYFTVGNISEEQERDYARRKGVTGINLIFDDFKF